MADAKTVLEFAQEHDAKILDLRFTDLPGLWHHVSYPIEQLTEAAFEEGFGIDGSSIRGWAAIHESDMLLMPDPSFHVLDPFTEVPTLVLVCNVVDPVTKQRYDRDPRYIAKKAETYLTSTGIADTAYFGAEAEFFIFDSVRFDQREQCGFYYIDAEEGRWNSGREENNLGYRPRYRQGYFPVPPTDHYQDLRSEMVLTMQSCGIEVESHHHEVATGGQTEIDVKFDSLLRSADKMLLYKYIVKKRSQSLRQDGDLHAQAALRRQRQRHAHASIAMERRSASLFRRRLRRPFAARPLVYRRITQARSRALGDHRPDNQFL